MVFQWGENDVIRLTAKNNFRLMAHPAWQAFEREGKGSFRCEKSEGRAKREGGKRLPGDHCFSRF